MKSPDLNKSRRIIPADTEQQYDIFTGRFLVTLLDESDDIRKLKSALFEKAGIRTAQSGDFADKKEISEEKYRDAGAFIYEDFGVAIIDPDEDQHVALNRISSEYNFIIEPEEVIFSPEPVPGVKETGGVTWGLDKTRVDESKYSGKGVSVAILDTGMDLDHPDFSGRNIKYKSFVPGESIDDLNGHGTHCTGIACGNTDNKRKRYGVANESDIFVGKVLGGTEGRGSDSWIINGINWAVNSGCNIISMSLGAPVYPRQTYKRAYERVAQYALKNNTLIIAAAGNESRRQYGIISPVGSPANCPSIMAVGAIDRNYHLADFSNGSINPDGQVDIVGPGINIYSSWPMKARYQMLNGTSMATPYVAGIAALYLEKNSGAGATDIWHRLIIHAKRLNLNSTDVGAGLVQAP